MKYPVVGIMGVLAALGLAGVSSDACAQSSVQLYGIIGTYVGSVKKSGSTPAALVEGGGGLTTSFWGIRGTEDIGGGTSVIFTLESFFQPTTGAQGRTAADPYWSRSSYVGITGDYGRVTFGRQTNPTYLNMQYLNPFGASVVFSPLVVQSFVAGFNGVIVGDTVWNNTVQYTTPTVSGLSATGIYGFGGVAGETGIANVGLHATYTNGPFLAAVSAQRVRTPVTSPVTEQYAWLGGATYNFGVAKVYAAAEATNAYGAQIGTHTYELGLSIPIAKTDSILMEWARTASSSAKVSTRRTTAALAYDYFLSKRTDVYLVYMYDKLTPNGSASTTALAIMHAF